MNAAPDAPRPLAMILALSKNRALGANGQLPWEHAEDRAYFKSMTRGHTVIMGRKSFEETNAPLEGCRTIIVSRTMAPRPDVQVVPSFDEALALAWTTDPEPFVLGGAAIYAEALPRVTTVHLTELPFEADGDVFYEPDLRGFALVHERLGEDGARYLRYERRA